VGLIATAGLILLTPSHQPAPSFATAVSAKSIAVLPFETPGGEQAYFADGVQDQILTKLAGVADLKVISRTSTEKYRSTPRNVKNAAQELGVASLLHGAVEKDGERVRIKVELFDGRTEARVWARSYEGDLRELFALEAEIAQQVANALQAKLSLGESYAVAAAPTRDPQAYDFFLRGEHEQRRGESVANAESFASADAFYRQALDLDPSFALAAARLARCRLWSHWMITPLSPAELDEVKTLVERALATAPDLAESHIALGMFHYHAHRDYEEALAAFQRALELRPNNADARQYCGYVFRRQGNWERSLVEMAKAEELNPHDWAIPASIAASYVNLRQWNDGKRAASRSLALTPNNLFARRALFLSCINGDGRTDAARRVIGPLQSGVRQTTNMTRGSVASIVEEFAYLHVLERDFAGAVKHADEANAGPDEHLARILARVAIRVLAGDTASGAAESEEARGILEERLRERPDDGVAMTQLSWVYLALGRHSDAVKMARQSAEWVPIEKDAIAGPVFAVGLAQIYSQIGGAREAVTILRHLLSIPAGIAISVNRLKLDPVWDPIRNNPEFQQLLARGEAVGQQAGYRQAKATDPPVAESRAAQTAPVPEKSIAVLPFDNMSDEKANAFFADGVQEEILTTLAKVAGLKVISRTSVMPFRNAQTRDLREIARQLGVTHVLEGSVQRAGNRVRVNAKLIDARNDVHLWAQTYDRDLADVFAIQSEIAKAIADQLQAKLSPSEKSAIEQPPTADVTAFDLYSRAKTLILTTTYNAVA
ncbi:MAG: tetratricopeptide repeat protein, partial [Betaproteobacteria bacterium]|nr:tetratricopeptide repeat protein [Betaproteobacteria bacterium]